MSHHSVSWSRILSPYQMDTHQSSPRAISFEVVEWSEQLKSVIGPVRRSVQIRLCISVCKSEKMFGIIIIINIIITKRRATRAYYYKKKNHTYATTHTQPQILTTTHSATRNTQTVRLAWLTDSRRTPDTGMNDLPSSQQLPTSDDTPVRNTGVSTISCLISRTWADKLNLCSVIY